MEKRKAKNLILEVFNKWKEEKGPMNNNGKPQLAVCEEDRARERQVPKNE